MILDRPLFGILLMLLFCLLAPLDDALAKLLGQSVPLTQLIFVRFAMQAALLIPLVYITGRKWRMSGWGSGFCLAADWSFDCRDRLYGDRAEVSAFG